MPRLHRAGIEYMTATISDAPTQVIAASIDGGVTFPITCARVDTTHVRFLVAGPSASSPGSATVLPLGRTVVLLRDTDSPELPIRTAGAIDVA